MKEELLGGFLPYQARWLADPARFKIGLWARQTGKDFTCAAEAVLDCVAQPRCHWLILACGERQARESLEKAREFARTLEGIRDCGLKFEDWGKAGGISNADVGASNSGGARGASAATSFGEARREPRATIPATIRATISGAIGAAIKRESATEIRFTNGSRITALPAKPGTVRGYSANLILTEFAFHDDPEGIWRAIFPSVSNGLRGGAKKVRIISTPNGQGNYFHELWTNSKIFSKHRTTIQKAKAQGLPIDLEELKEGLLDAEAWAQEYECEFVDQSAVLLPYELIEGCEAAEATETSSVEELSRLSGELYVGIDFGRKQDLTVCWVLEKVRQNAPIHRSPTSVSSAALSHIFVTREVLVMRRTPTPVQIEALRPRVQRARRVCVDYTGAGIGLGDALGAEFGAAQGAKDWRGKVELCTFTAGLKEEIFVKMRAGFERRQVWIPRSAEIREDLHSMHRVVSPSGQISFRASRSGDGHSDRCTALALAWRAAESAPVSQGATSVGRGFPRLR